MRLSSRKGLKPAKGRAVYEVGMHKGPHHSPLHLHSLPCEAPCHAASPVGHVGATAIRSVGGKFWMVGAANRAWHRTSVLLAPQRKPTPGSNVMPLAQAPQHIYGGVEGGYGQAAAGCRSRPLARQLQRARLQCTQRMQPYRCTRRHGLVVDGDGCFLGQGADACQVAAGPGVQRQRRVLEFVAGGTPGWQGGTQWRAQQRSSPRGGRGNAMRSALRWLARQPASKGVARLAGGTARRPAGWCRCCAAASQQGRPGAVGEREGLVGAVGWGR